METNVVKEHHKGPVKHLRTHYDKVRQHPLPTTELLAQRGAEAEFQTVHSVLKLWHDEPPLLCPLAAKQPKIVPGIRKVKEKGVEQLQLPRPQQHTPIRHAVGRKYYQTALPLHQVNGEV